MNESSACMSFLLYFHAAVSNHLSEKPNIRMSCFIWSLDTGLTKCCGCFVVDGECCLNSFYINFPI